MEAEAKWGFNPKAKQQMLLTIIQMVKMGFSAADDGKLSWEYKKAAGTGKLKHRF